MQSAKDSTKAVTGHLFFAYDVAIQPLSQSFEQIQS